jgi:hypothetical protein
MRPHARLWVLIGALVLFLGLAAALNGRGGPTPAQAQPAGQRRAQQLREEHLHLKVRHGGVEYGVRLTIVLNDDGSGDFPQRAAAAKARLKGRFPGAVEVQEQTLESGTQTYVLGGYSWPAHTTSWAYNPAGKPGYLSDDATVLAASANVWNNAGGADWRFSGGGTTTRATGACRSSDSTVALDGANTVGWYPQSDNVLAVTCTWYNPSTGQAVEFDMEIDPAWSWTTSTSGVQIDLQSVVAHEFGHALGLGHTTVCPGSLMCPTYAPGTVLRTPQADDINGLIALYGRVITVPAAPSNLRVTNVAGTSVSLAWDDNATDETHYQVGYRASGALSLTVLQFPANTTAATITGLRTGTIYTFQVRACNEGACSAWSNQVTAMPGGNATPTPTATATATGTATPSPTPAPSGVPAAPTNLRVTAVGATSVTLAWDDNATNETRYELWYQPSGALSWSRVLLAADSTGYTVSALRSGTTYLFQVRACNSLGCSPWSNQASATTGTAGSATPTPSPTATGTATPTPTPAPSGVPAAPTNLVVAGLTATSVTLAWTDNATDETRYELWYRPTAALSWLRLLLAADTTTTTVSGLRTGTSYVFQVRACNAVGCSSWSNQVAATPGLDGQ